MSETRKAVLQGAARELVANQKAKRVTVTASDDPKHMVFFAESLDGKTRCRGYFQVMPHEQDSFMVKRFGEAVSLGLQRHEKW